LPPPPDETAESSLGARGNDAGEDLPPGAIAIRAQVPGSIWQLLVKPGDHVTRGDKVVVLETMKMETAVLAPADGVVSAVSCGVGAQVTPGQLLLALTAAATS
jgi:urea carboxylase